MLLDALDRRGITIIPSRHETGTVGAADGYARATGRLGVALIIADQGVPNAITGIATAFHAGSPVLVIVARLPDGWIEAEAETDLDKLASASPVAKYARTPPSAIRVPDYFAAAVKTAISGRPGPAILSIKQNFFTEAAPKQPYSPPIIPRPAPAPDAIEAAAELLLNAQRPLAVAGAGALYAHHAGTPIQSAAKTLVERFGVPIMANSLGRGVVPEDRETSMSWPFGQYAADQADVVLAIGTRFKQRMGFGRAPRFAADAKFIQIDLDPGALNRNRPTDIGIVADAGEGLAALVEALSRRTNEKIGSSHWLRDSLSARNDHLARTTEAVSNAAAGTPAHPLHLGRAVNAALPDDALIVGDGADIQNWLYGAIEVRGFPGFMDHYPLGSMGIGTPLAVGAAAGLRELGEGRPLVMLTGDGAFGFFPMELAEAQAAGLNLTVIIGNDGAWGTEKHGQQRAIGRAVNTDLAPVDYAALARAMGCRGHRVSQASELESALQGFGKTPGVSVIDVQLDPEAGEMLKTDPMINMIRFDDLGAQHD